MSTTGARAAAGPGSAPAPPKASALERVRARVAGTPGRMRAVSAAAVAALVVLGVFGALAVRAGSHDLANAQADAAQLVRVQTIRTAVVQADANATNSFLVGGLGPPSQRAAYVAEVSTAAGTLAAASADNRTDASALGGVNQALTTYTGLIESARADNRQGFAVSSAYLASASALLRSNILPSLSALQSDVETRVAADYRASHGAAAPLWVLGVLAVIVLGVAQAWLAVRTRRWVNLGFAAASVVLLVALTVAGGVLFYAQRKADRVDAGAYSHTAEEAQARVDAFDAKSDESLTLIFRGSGQAYEADFQTAAADAVRQLSAAGAGPTTRALDSYLATHRNVRADDDGGNWDAAVALATGSNPAGSNVRFASFNQASSADLTAQAASGTRGLHDARLPLAPVAWVILAAGLAGAVLAAWGMAFRLREYR